MKFEKVEIILYPGESFLPMSLETAGFLVGHLTKLLPDEEVQDWIDFIQINIEGNAFVEEEEEEEGWVNDYDSGSLYD